MKRRNFLISPPALALGAAAAPALALAAPAIISSATEAARRLISCCMKYLEKRKQKKSRQPVAAHPGNGCDDQDQNLTFMPSQ